MQDRRGKKSLNFKFRILQLQLKFFQGYFCASLKNVQVKNLLILGFGKSHIFIHRITSIKVEKSFLIKKYKKKPDISLGHSVLVRQYSVMVECSLHSLIFKYLCKTFSHFFLLSTTSSSSSSSSSGISTFYYFLTLTFKKQNLCTEHVHYQYNIYIQMKFC